MVSLLAFADLPFSLSLQGTSAVSAYYVQARNELAAGNFIVPGESLFFDLFLRTRTLIPLSSLPKPSRPSSELPSIELQLNPSVNSEFQFLPAHL